MRRRNLHCVRPKLRRRPSGKAPGSAEPPRHRPPARRIVYRSVGARAARVAVGVVFVVATLVIALPVLASEHAPPPPTGLFIGVNGPPAGITPDNAGSFLRLDIRAAGCTNPVTVEGSLERSDRAWRADEREARRYPGPRTPSQAIVAVSFAALRTAEIGLGASPDAVGRAPLVGVLGEPLIDGTATILLPVQEREVTVHNNLSRVFSGVPSTASGANASAAVLTAPDWPTVRVPLHFVLRADLMRPLAFHRCYVDVPELFSTNAAGYDAYREAGEMAKSELVAMVSRAGYPAGLPSQPEVSAAEVTVAVSGHVVAVSSIGRGGVPTAEGVRYTCHTYVNRRPPPNLDPRMFETEMGTSNYEEGANPNCSASRCSKALGSALMSRDGCLRLGSWVRWPRR